VSGVDLRKKHSDSLPRNGELNEVCWQILNIDLAVKVWVTRRDRPIVVRPGCDSRRNGSGEGKGCLLCLPT